MGGAAAVAAAAVARARRRLIAHFKDKGATGADAAVAYVPERGIERRLLEQLIEKGVLHQTRPGSYWLDETALGLWTKSRRRRAGALVGAAVALGAAIGFLASGG
jgi:hypothetical protein